MKKLFAAFAVVAILALGALPNAFADGPDTQTDQTDAICIPCLFQRPDLKVSTWNAVYVPGSGWYLRFTVANVGRRPAGPFKIALRSAFNNATLFTFSDPGLAVGASHTYSYRTGYCEFDLKIVVDSTNAVLEINEGNNVTRATHIC